MGPKWQMCISSSSAQSERDFSCLATPSLTLDCRARMWNWLNLFVGGCVQSSYDDCLAIGDVMVILIIMILSMSK